MGIFNEFHKKEKPSFTGIARGFGFGFGAHCWWWWWCWSFFWFGIQQIRGHI